MLCSHSLPVTEPSQVGEARRQVQALAERLGFPPEAAGRAALVTTELATNVLRHGGGGELVVRPLERGGRAGVEVLALDRGPGMAHPEQCLEDGFSSRGSQGTGLGSIRRGAAHFELYAPPGLGTAVWVELWPGEAPPAERLAVGAVCLPMAGQPVSGDAWHVEVGPEGAVALVSDGLGHGPRAAEASLTAVRTLRARPALSPAEQLHQLHGALRRTRGAAVAVAAVDLRVGRVAYAGVGNVSGAVLAHAQRSNLVSLNGTLGQGAPKVQQFPYLFPGGALLVMHSDGLSTSWQPERYPGLLARHPALVAGVLYRDACRGRDDCTVLVLREAAW